MNFYAIYLNVRRDNITLEFEELSQLWISWISCTLDLVIDRLWVQTWLRTKVLSFAKFSFSMNMEGFGNPSSQ